MIRTPRLTAVAIATLVLTGVSTGASAEILVRWDQERIPSPAALRIATVVMPATATAAIGQAIGQGYRVLLEVPAAALPGFKVPHRGVAGVLVTGNPTAAALRLIARQIDTPGARVAVVDERGKWPHIRTNWVTRNNDVLVVTNRSSQPWIENNAALLRIVRAARPDRPAPISYPW